MPTEKVQRFGYWEWIVTRACPNGHTIRLIAGRTRRFGRPHGPTLPTGGTTCPTCNEIIRF